MNRAVSFALSSAALVLVLTLALSSTDSPAHAENGHFDVVAGVSVASTTPGAPRALTTTISVPGSEINIGNSLNFEPIGVVITPGCNEPGFRDFDDNGSSGPGETPCLNPGDLAGSQSSSATVGVANGPCNFPVPVTHNLINVALPNNELDPRAATNLVYPRPPGDTNRFGGWQVGSFPPSGGGTAPDDVDSNDRADGTSLAFQNYPAYLLDVFDPDDAGPLDPVLPLAVYGGLTEVFGQWAPVFIAQFEAGDLPAAYAGLAPHPFSRAAAPLGHPSQNILGDPTTFAPSPGGLATDFCSPLSSTATFNATVGGITRAANPMAGTSLNLAWQMSQRDLDNDGYENSLDSCPNIANTENPHSSGGPDTDALDSACDPTPATDVDDQDGDLYLNGQDNCPLLANPTQDDGEANGPGDYPVSAFDGGSLGDQIGSACDSGSVTITQNNLSTTINTSATVANGHWHAKGTVIPICYGGVDADADGYCAGSTDAADSGPCAGTVPPSCAVRHASWTAAAAFSQLLLFDTDRGGGDLVGTTDPGGVGTIPCTGGATDLCPENAFDSDWLETYVGVNPAQACPQSSGTNNEPYDSWVYDVNDDRNINLSDVVAFGASFNKFVNAPGGSTRFDINADGAVNLSDISAYGPVFHKSCRRVDGTFGAQQ